MGKRLRILIVAYEDLVAPTDDRPPVDAAYCEEGLEIVAALRELRHEVRTIGIAGDLAPMRAAIDSWAPHIVFNRPLVIHGRNNHNGHVAAYLELLSVPHTGCNARGLMLADDKPLARKIFCSDRILTPSFVVIARQTAPSLPLPSAIPSS